MTHIANQRIKLGGKLYMPGDPIEPSAEDLADLPEGAVAEVAVAAPASFMMSEQDAAALKGALGGLSSDSFKKDGGIRADALKELVAQVGFDATAEAVDAIIASSNDESA